MITERELHRKQCFFSGYFACPKILEILDTEKLFEKRFIIGLFHYNMFRGTSNALNYLIAFSQRRPIPSTTCLTKRKTWTQSLLG